jgi:hypothetical protein
MDKIEQKNKLIISLVGCIKILLELLCSYNEYPKLKTRILALVEKAEKELEDEQ